MKKLMNSEIVLKVELTVSTLKFLNLTEKKITTKLRQKNDKKKHISEFTESPLQLSKLKTLIKIIINESVLVILDNVCKTYISLLNINKNISKTINIDIPQKI
jgi:hypothetical protein